MKKILAFAVVLCLSFASLACAQSLGGLAMPGLAALAEKVKVNPYAQAGFQHLGSNMSLPVSYQGPPVAGTLQIDTVDISMQNANFWTGNIGVNVSASDAFSVFAAAGGILPHEFIVTGQIPVNVGGAGSSPNIEFTASKAESWYIMTGTSFGPILAGLYWAHFTVDVGDPRQNGVPLANQTLRGYVLSKTFAPFIGFAVPATNALLTVVYSPLAWCNTTLALRTSGSSLAQAQYKWNKPGNFLSATAQYNTPPVKSLSLGLWVNCTWMDVRGNASLEFENATTSLYREKDVTATMTTYVTQGGLTLGATF